MLVSDEHNLLFHYTSSNGLQGILGTRALFATHCRFLNDSSETNRLLPRLAEEMQPHVQKAITKLAQGSSSNSERVKALGGLAKASFFESQTIAKCLYRATFEMKSSPNFFEPFIISFCQHSDDYDLDNGLLSQWRAYANSSGYCIAFSTQGLEKRLLLEGENNAYSSAHLSTVVYDDDRDGFQSEFAKLLEAIPRLVQSMFFDDRPEPSIIFEPYVQSVMRYKHRAFKEEAEVRAVLPPITQYWMAELKNNDPEQYEKIQNKRVKQIKFRNGFIPYIEVGLDEGGALPIEYIIVGPGKDQKERKYGLEKFLELNRMPIRVIVSATPLV